MRRIAGDRRGATLIEFAILTPVLLLIVFGSFDAGHALYVRTVLEGELQKAGRDISLEGASSPARRLELEQRVREQVQAVAPGAEVEFETVAFHDYRHARDRGEEFSDDNGNGTCDNGEAFADYNGNGMRDADSGTVGRGGAKDVVLFNATATYPKLAFGRILGRDPMTEVSASTLLRNQPSENQAPVREGRCG